MCCCCGARMCMLCSCVILVAIAIGLVFGFGVYKNGFHKLKDALHDCQTITVNGSAACSRRPLFYSSAPSPL